MQKAVLYGIIAAVVTAASIGVAFGAMSMNGVTTEAANQQQQQDSNPRLIKHAMGETEITGTPKRIVALQWNYVEDLLAVGVQPVGVADIQTMKQFVSLGDIELSENVVDVGLRYEPNLEAIAQLEPDLIIGDYSGNGKSYEQLNAIAPTILFDPYPVQDNGIDRMEEMEQTFMTIADIVGRHEQGVAVLERMNKKLDEAKAAIQASDASGKPFVLVMTGSYKDDYTKFRIWTQNARAAEIIEKMGMENAWNVDYAQYGYSEIGLEHLTTVQDANFFYVAGGGHDPFVTELYTVNPVWQDLNFVKEGRVYPLGGDTWLYGGPISAEILADKVVTAVTDEQSNTRTVKHQMGETEITGIPKRIVVLEWTYAEHVMALGIEPVGVADIETMNKWVNLKGQTLSSNVVDVGLRWEPNLEVISQLEPDLIIGDSDNNGPIYEDLSAIAPTLLFNAYPLEGENVGGFERMKEEFMTIADVLGRHEQGIAVLERMDQKIAEGRAAVQASGAAGKPFALLMAGTWEGATWLRIYTPNGQASQIIEMMGMENAWPVEYGKWGYSDASLEDLTRVQDANFFYIALDEDNPFETTYKDNPVWRNLNAVKEGRVYPIGGDTWTYGGPISAELIVEKVMAAVTAG